MTYSVTIGSDNQIQELFHADNNNAPFDAIPVSDADGGVLRHGFAGYHLVNGVIIYSIQLLVAKAQRKAAINTARDAACFTNVTALNRLWQADKRSQELLGQAITLAQAGLPLPAVWRDAANNDMAVAAIADLLAIAGAMAAQTQTAYAHSWALKAQIDSAATSAEVEAITW